MEEVTECYEVVDGMNGMQRDIILRICRLLWDKSSQIREIIGMCEKYFSWRFHSYFFEGRPVIVSHAFRTNPLGKYNITSTPLGVQCSFNLDRSEFRVLFLDVLIKKGVFHWTLQCNYSTFTLPGSDVTKEVGDTSEEKDDDKGNGGFGSVVVAPGYLSQFETQLTAQPKGACSFFFGQWNDTLMSYVFDGLHMTELPSEDVAVEDGAVIEIEVDTYSRTHSIFIEGNKIPYAIAGLILPLRLGIAAASRASFTSVLLRRLPSATPSSVQTMDFQFILDDGKGEYTRD